MVSNVRSMKRIAHLRFNWMTRLRPTYCRCRAFSTVIAIRQNSKALLMCRGIERVDDIQHWYVDNDVQSAFQAVDQLVI